MFRKIIILALIVLTLTGCFPKLRLFQGNGTPLKAFTLSGSGDKKVLLIPVRGFITDAPAKGLLRTRPGMVQNIVSQLRKAQADPDIRAVILKIDTPGGTVTASDMLYHELMKYKTKTGAKIVAAMTNLAASGGYYIALPADRIMAHPTTITGSVGVVFIRSEIHQLMDRIGYQVKIYKAGDNKDMGSPFRPPTPAEQTIMNDMIGALGKRFHDLVQNHRNLSDASMQTVKTARIFLASEALRVGLVDEIGYMDDAVNAAKELGNMPENSRLIVYRNSEYPDDTIYNTAAGQSAFSLTAWQQLAMATGLASGAYYVWPGAVMGQ